MANIALRAKVELSLTVVLSEPEARALDALAGYGDDAFIEAFKEKLGSAYMSYHEAGLRSFLRSARETIPQYLDRAKKARDAFEGKEE